MITRTIMLLGFKPTTKDGVSTRIQGEKMETRREAADITTLEDSRLYTVSVEQRTTEQVDWGSVNAWRGQGRATKEIFRPTYSAETRRSGVPEGRGTKWLWPVLRYDRCMSGAAEENHHNSVISRYELAIYTALKAPTCCVVRLEAHPGKSSIQNNFHGFPQIQTAAVQCL
jgi:hypothetical protein